MSARERESERERHHSGVYSPSEIVLKGSFKTCIALYNVHDVSYLNMSKKAHENVCYLKKSTSLLDNWGGLILCAQYILRR